MPLATSVCHLREKIIERLRLTHVNEMLVVPSEEWIRLQFWENLYTYGSVLFPPGSRYEKSIIVREALTCNSTIETEY